jgi:hypothetical protein
MQLIKVWNGSRVWVATKVTIGAFHEGASRRKVLMSTLTVSGITLNRLRVSDFRLTTAARFTASLLARLHQS